MDSILSFFEFASQSITLLLARFGIELACVTFVTFLVAVIILQFTKSKNHAIGFSNWFKICYMIGIEAAVLALGVIVIYILHVNGLWYFSHWTWDWTNGYLLVLPEFFLMMGLETLYCVLYQKVKQSI